MILFCLVKQISMYNKPRKTSKPLARVTCNFKFGKHGCSVSKIVTHKQDKDYFTAKLIDCNEFW